MSCRAKALHHALAAATLAGVAPLEDVVVVLLPMSGFQVKTLVHFGLNSDDMS